MPFDTQLFFFLNSFAGRTPALDGVIVFFASYFPYLLVAAVPVLVFFSGYPFRKKLEIVFVAGLSAIIARLGFVELIRFFYHRPRPFSVLEVNQLFGDSAWSFPSGHASFFFALAAALFFYNKKWGIVFAVAALFITAGRVVAGVHYPSDILGGALLGILVGYGVVFFARRFKKDDIGTH